LTDVGTRLGGWAARARQEAMRTVARTREELEDIWAEAQAVRHQESAEPAEGHDEARDDGHAGERHDGQAAPRRRARPQNTRQAE